MAGKHILIVDDEDTIRFGMRAFLEARGFRVTDVDSCEKARQAFQSTPPDIAILDYRLHDGTALDLLGAFKEQDADIPLLVLPAHGSIDLAVQAVKQGADQFLTKPIELPALLTLVLRLLDNRRLRRQHKALASREVRERIDPLAGDSPAICALAEQARKVTGTDSPVLILGETGTGKSLLAQWLHRNGPRADEPFVDLNCAGLSPDFLESELFGHEKGAFTGAVQRKQGLLEVADGGTVFLDEIGDVDPRVQPKLLKVLEEKRFRRMGSVKERGVDIALIAATHHDLARRVHEGHFRNDLYFRINSIPLTMPALRDRKQDIPGLARSLLGHLGRPQVQLTADAEQALIPHDWPGNIRELRNVLERAVLLCDNHQIRARDLRFEASHLAPDAAIDTGRTLQQVERDYIKQVLSEVGGKVAEAALRLDVPRSTLYQKIKNYGIQ